MYQDLSESEQLDAIIANLETADGPTALGGCIFGGGFSFGMEQAGFDVIGHLELPDLALGTHVSRQRWPVFNGPLSSRFYPEMRVEQLGWMDAIKALPRKPDVFYANPPCVAYAGVGKHMGTSDDRMCYLRYVSYETAMTLQPTIWAWELVPGILQGDLAFLEAMAFRAHTKGYESHAFLTTSANHGGFQDRRRFHFIASKVGLDFSGVYQNVLPEEKGSRTLGDALKQVRFSRLKAAGLDVDDEDEWGPMGVLKNDVVVYDGAFTQLIPHCPPGSHLRDLPDDIYREHYHPESPDKPWSGKGRPGFSHTRGRLERPSPNILGGYTVIHPVLDRYLTAREGAAVMGFPMDYVFSEGTKGYQEIGRGLCTHNALFVGRVMAEALRAQRPIDRRPIDGRYLRIVDWRNNTKRMSNKMSKVEQAIWMNTPDDNDEEMVDA